MTSLQPQEEENTWAQARENSHQLILQAALEDLENKATKWEQELLTAKATVESQRDQISSLQQERSTLQSTVETQRNDLTKLRGDLQKESLQVDALREIQTQSTERMDRLQAEGDTLREEISRLTKSNLEYQDKLVQMETQAKLGGSEVVPLKMQVHRMTTEIDTISSHNTWLNSQLESQTELLAKTRKNHATEIAQVRSALAEAIGAQEAAAAELANLQRQMTTLEAKNDRLSRELLDVQTNAAQAKADAEEELQKTQTVVQMQKTQLEFLQQKHDSVVGQLQALKKHALEAEQETDRALQVRAQELEIQSKQVLQDQAADFQQQVANLQEELRLTQRRLKDAEDGLLLANTPSRRGGSAGGTARATLAIRDRAEPATTDDEEPLNLTELYVRLAETEDALAAERLRRKKTQILLERIKAEIEASAPNYIRQRKEFEKAIERQQEYKKRLTAALDEAKAARQETNEYQSEMSRLQARNKELEEETRELAKQVQTLLVARSNSGSFGLGGDTGPPSAPSTAVVQMQTTNQRLSAQVRKMTETIKELEGKLQEDTLRKQVDAYEQDLATLREERRRQEVMVESIVQQRDLYRALLAKQDSQLLASPEEESSALQLVQRHSARAKSLEEAKNSLEMDLARARADLATRDKDKEMASERLARYEALNEELTKTVDRLQAEVSQANGAVARNVAEATFYREKIVRLEETLERHRNEVDRITAAKSDLQRINADLQDAMSKANAEKSRYESELEQTKMKLRLAEAQTEQAKASEQRIADESNQLRIEISRQGALIESIQRIESRLSVKASSDEEQLKAQVASLTEKLAAAENKNNLQIDNLNGKVADQEVTIKDLELQRDQATKDALDAKNEALKATQELQAATKKCSQLEGQLRAAKKKLGDTVVEDDAEGQLKIKISSLTEELEASRNEIIVLKERVQTFEKLAKESEAALADQTKASLAAKQSHDAEIAGLQSQLEAATTESVKGKEVITELTNDLAAQRGERAKELDEVKKRITELEGQLEHYQQVAESAQNRYSLLEAEVVVLRADVTSAQTNYERELALHAAARTDLRAVKEEVEAESRLRKLAEAQAAAARTELEERKASLEQEKAQIQKSVQEYEKTLEDTRAQNTLLHSQLEKIAEQIERMQGGQGGTRDASIAETDTDEVATLRKTIVELREVVKFVRADKDLVQAQLDAARRVAERERAVASVAKRSLEEARAELKLLQDKVDGSPAGGETEGPQEKLKAAQQQTKLLGESNAHLREEMRKLESSVSALKAELESAKSASIPSDKQLKVLETEKAGLLAEKESLQREINDWKGRVQSLVSRFNQVDPAEHASLLKKAESLEAQVKLLESQKQSAEDDCTRIRNLATRASKELMQNKALVESHTKAIAALTAQKEALEKAQKEGASQKDLSEAKDKLTKLEAERANEKIQLTGAQEMNDKLRERLRQFQKTITDLKQKEATLEKELKDTKDDLERQRQSAPATGTVTTEETKKQASIEGAAKTTKALSKPSTIDAGSSDRTTPAAQDPPKESIQDAVATKKPEKNVLLSVPPGGFKFAPSPPEQTKSPAKAAPPTAAPPAPAPNVSESAVPVEPDMTARSSNKRPAELIEDVAETKKAKPQEPTVAESATESSSAVVAATGEPDVVDTTKGSDSSSGMQRRGSGETKELSMKEKLLQKRSKLILALQKKKEQMEIESSVDKDEPVAKKSKVDNASAIEQSTTEDSQGPVETGSASAEKEQDEPDSIVETLDLGQTRDDAVPSVSTVSTVLNPFASSFTPQGSVFGSTQTGFGVPSGGFGQNIIEPAMGQTAPSEPAPSFGQVSFGTGSSLGGNLFGRKDPTTAITMGSGFGGTSTGFGSGSAFLNIKPPGSSAAPPTFSFGSSASIVLPTPANPSPQSSMFSAFSVANQPSPFAAKPLFGMKKEAETLTETKEQEGEDGEVEEGEQPPEPAA